MENLKSLRDKLRYEIEGTVFFEKKEDDEPEFEPGGESKSYERLSTATKVKGKVVSGTYDFDYADLLDFLNMEVPNINWTLPKVRATFKAIREFIGFDSASDKKKRKEESEKEDK